VDDYDRTAVSVIAAYELVAIWSICSDNRRPRRYPRRNVAVGIQCLEEEVPRSIVGCG
jgi:hypothetical protein